MRKFVSLLLAILFMYLCTGCSNTSDDKETSAFIGGDTYFFDNKIYCNNNGIGNKEYPKIQVKALDNIPNIFCNLSNI